VNHHIDPAACIFCKIVAGEAPGHRVYEDERVLVFLDIFPVADGHTLVIPKRHATDLLGCQADDLASVVQISQRVAQAQRTVFDPDGIGVFQLNGAAAGQTVFHYHMHLIPRNQGDKLVLHSRTPGDPATLKTQAVQLAEALPSSAG
jgi:histidine triad (HIT) family protein